MTLRDLLQQIDSGSILGPRTFEQLDFDEVYDGREAEEFESAWLKAFREICEREFSPSETVEIDAVREAAFKAAFRHCEDASLSGFICDDFELIAKALLRDDRSGFVNGLWKTYREESIPRNSVPELPGRISEVE